MSDPRVEAYAKLLVEDCLDVQPGWQVMVTAGALARPLLEAIGALPYEPAPGKYHYGAVS